MAVGQRIGKVGVISGVCDGFIGNRMLHKRFAQVERLLIEGALPQEIDAALTEFGFAMGPCAVGDLAGLDVGWRIRKERGTKAPISDALCEAGRFGQKTGKGYYLYEPGSRVPRPDPEVERLILETSKRLGVERRPISKEEIVERTIYPMINEGARILEEGIAMRLRRYRCRLDLWLWLAGRTRRADVLRRPGRARRDRGPARPLCR